MSTRQTRTLESVKKFQSHHLFVFALVFAPTAFAFTGRRAEMSQSQPSAARPRYSVIVVAEGAYAEDGEPITVDDRHDAFGHARLGGVGEVLASRIRSETPYDARAAALGHPQRGGAPSPVDRVMGMMFGARAAEAVSAGEFGKMVSARGVAPACDLSLVEITEVLDRINTVDVERHYDTERYHLKGIGM